ncbi:MAG: acetyltransferase [Gemmatimonadaceae bacterium]
MFWGATGHAKVLREFVHVAGYRLVALFDNNPEVQPPFGDVPLYYGREGFSRWRTLNPALDMFCLVAIGGAKGGARVELQSFLVASGLCPATVVHPTAFVAADASLGQGSQVLAHAAVGVEATLGDCAIINTAASVDHECILGAGVHIAPGARLAGCVSVGDRSLVGVGAVVLPRVRIGADAIVGAGSVVTRDVPDGEVVFGVPARIQRTVTERYKEHGDPTA